MRRTLAVLGMFLAASGATAGVLSAVSGPDDLDLSGNVYYAVTLGTTSDQVVGRWFFDADNDGRTSAGYSVVAPNKATSGWGFGTITDPGLKATYDSMRYNGGAPVDVTLTGLPPGEQVKVQLLLSEGYWQNSSRRVDIDIDGTTEFTNVDPYALWGYEQPGLATATATVSSDGTLEVRLRPAAGTPDPNPVLDGILVSAIGAKAVGSAADLDLERVRYAVNVGGSDDQTVAGVVFEADNDGDGKPAGYTIVSNQIAANWASPSIADPALREVYDDIRWNSGGAVDQSFAGLAPDRPVKVQVLLCEGWHDAAGSRPVDITVQGYKKVDNLDPIALWGKNGTGVVTTYGYVGADGMLKVSYTADGGSDHNPIVNAVIVSDIPGKRVRPVRVSASAVYSSQFPASAVIDGSWSETATNNVFDFWLLPDRQGGYLEFDFAQGWDLEYLAVHNTDNRGYHDRGTIAYHIDISPDPSFEVTETIAAGTLPTYDYGWYVRPLDSDQLWRYARFYVDDFGGSSVLTGGGLAEIAFYGNIPEPGTLALLGGGLLALARRRRRRRRA